MFCLFLLGLLNAVELLVDGQQLFLGELNVSKAADHGQQTQYGEAAHHGHHIAVELEAGKAAALLAAVTQLR